MMIERHWKGLAKPEKAQQYVGHLQNDTFKRLKKLDGFISARILKRIVAEGVEFLIITEWETPDAIGQFAGKDFDRAVVPDFVQNLMIRYDECVYHYEVSFTTNSD